MKSLTTKSESLNKWFSILDAYQNHLAYSLKIHLPRIYTRQGKSRRLRLKLRNLYFKKKFWCLIPMQSVENASSKLKLENHCFIGTLCVICQDVVSVFNCLIDLWTSHLFFLDSSYPSFWWMPSSDYSRMNTNITS